MHLVNTWSSPPGSDTRSKWALVAVFSAACFILGVTVGTGIGMGIGADDCIRKAPTPAAPSEISNSQFIAECLVCRKAAMACESVYNSVTLERMGVRCTDPAARKP